MMTEADSNETSEGDVTRSGHPNGGSWIDLGIALLATIGLLTIVIGGSLLLSELIQEDDQPQRVIIVEPDEPDRYCYEEVVPVGGGLFGDVEPDDFDAEARFAEDRRTRVIVVCEDW